MVVGQQGGSSTPIIDGADSAAMVEPSAAGSQQLEEQGGAIDRRVELAFASLNSAILANNTVESNVEQARQALDAAILAERQEMAALTEQHEPELRRYRAFSEAKAEAHRASQELERTVRTLGAAMDLERMAVEAIALQREGASAHERAQTEWQENLAALERRRGTAAAEVKRLRGERKALDAAVTRATRRLASMSKQLWQTTSPLVCDRPDSLERERLALEQALAQRQEESLQASDAVRCAMAALENVSVGISGQELFDECV